VFNAPLKLQLTDYRADLAPHLRYLIDGDRALTPEEAVERVPTDEFKPVETSIVDFGFSKAQFWLWAEVENAAKAPGTWNLVLGNPLSDDLSVFLVPLSGEGYGEPVELLSHGLDETFAARELAYRNFVATFRLAPQQRAGLLITYSSKAATQQSLFIESPDYFFAQADQEDMHNFFVLGLLLGMTLVSVIYLTALRSRAALYYGLYICAAALYLFQTDGYAFQFLWPSWPGWNTMAVIPIGAVWAAAGLQFARSFVDAPKNHPTLNKLFVAGLIGSALMFVSSFWLFETPWFKLVALALAVYCTSLYVAAGVAAVRRGQAGGRFFFAGSIIVVAPILVGLVSYALPGQFSQDMIGHGARYALVLEATVFALAIFANLFDIRRERDEAMRREIAETKERLAAVEALQEAKEKHARAVQLAERRRDQLATTAHDIQQPLAALRMALRRVENLPGLEGEKIAGSLSYLDQLIDRNLQQTRPSATADDPGQPNDFGETDDHHASFAASAQDKPAAENFPVSVVLDNVARMFEAEAHEKGLGFRAVPSSLSVTADPIGLMRIVSNLVSNAVKYTDRGRILLGCRPSQDRIRIEVHDTGPGMTREEIDRVLQPYEKGKTGGTGLGLAVVSRLAREQGFVFGVTSTPGRGSVFSVSVPRS
jgi:two-component system, sensor histidine kinase LadS